MHDSVGRDVAGEPAKLRLRTLIVLRWIAIAGQSAAVLTVYFVLGYDLPLSFCFALIALSAWLNLFLRMRYGIGYALSARFATLLLAYDVVQLAALLALTGGLINPFSILFLVPVVVSAGALPRANTAFLGALVLTAATVIAIVHAPLPWFGDTPPWLPPLYVAGIWTALASTLVFMAIYALRVAEEAREMSQALTATELVLAREQHLSALDGLAAAAVHELGTPLSTIALVARELERDMPGDAHAEDFHLLRSQVERCRDILERIGSLGEEMGNPFERAPLSGLIEEIVAPYRAFAEVAIASRGEPPEPVLRRDPALLYGLGNLIENAAEFARSRVTVTARWDAGSITIEIADDGPGFAAEIVQKLGEPYVTTRRRRHDQPEAGLGLGLFIARTLLQRTEARLSFGGREAPATGAVVEVRWERPCLLESTPEAPTVLDTAVSAGKDGGAIRLASRPTS